MKRIALALVLFASVSAIARPKMPPNTSVHVCSCDVAQSASCTTNVVSFAARGYKVGIMAFNDTAIAKQDTIDMGAGVTVEQQIGITNGDRFSKVSADTFWTQMGDTTNSAFINAVDGNGISRDSLIVDGIDTTQTDFLKCGEDSLQVSKGYFVMLPDPSPMTRFIITGKSDFGATNKRVYVIVNSFQGDPIWDR